MGLRISIYRDGYNSPINVFRDVSAVTLLNVDGPFGPTPDAPAAVLVKGPGGHPVIRPAIDDTFVDDPTGRPNMAFGGSYGATSDSRFSNRLSFYGAVPVHDRDLALEAPGGMD